MEPQKCAAPIFHVSSIGFSAGHQYYQLGIFLHFSGTKYGNKGPCYFKQYAKYLWVFLGVFIWAFAATANTMVSNVIGQGRKDEVIPLIRKIVRLSTGAAVTICLLLNLIPGFLLTIYAQGPEFITRAIPVVRIVSIAMVLMSFSLIWLNSIHGTGHSRITLIIELFAIVFYCIYVYTTLEKFKLGINVGWMSEWIYWMSLFSLSLYI